MNEKMLIHILKADYRYYKSEIENNTGIGTCGIYVRKCKAKLEYIKELLIGLLPDYAIKELDETVFTEYTDDYDL